MIGFELRRVHQSDAVRIGVHDLFAHADEVGIGAVFGKGKANPTMLATDGGQFESAATKDFAAPTPFAER